MSNYVNYRYRDFANHSFHNEFRAGDANYADFTGSRLRSCDFQGASLVGADFSETAIGRDEKIFQSQIMLMTLHIICGIPLGLLAWVLGRAVAGCGIAISDDPYVWLTNPFSWILAFATAATMSKRWIFGLYMGLIGLMVLTALVGGFALGAASIIVMLAAFGMSLLGMYLGYKQGSIAVGIVWMTVGVSSAISAGYSWLEYQEIHYAILFAILTIIPASLATKAFNLHFAKVKMAAMTSFCRADLTNARFVNAVLHNCDFSMAKLAGVDWSGATFSNCKFPKGWSPNWQEAIAQDVDANQSIEKVVVKEL